MGGSEHGPGIVLAPVLVLVLVVLKQAWGPPYNLSNDPNNRP